MECHFGSEAVVVHFRAVAVLGDSLHRDFDVECSAECQDLKFQRLVVLADGCGPYGVAKFNSLGLCLYRRWLQEFVGHLVRVHVPLVRHGNAYGNFSSVLQCACTIFHVHFRGRHRVHVELFR